MKYPRSRRSPARHSVRKHTRSGKTIQSFQRGKGTRGRSTPRKVVGEDMKTEGSTRETWEIYKVKFLYSKGRSETVIVAAEDTDDAVNHAMPLRRMKLKPIRTEVDDSIASVTAALVGGAAQFVGGVISGVGTATTRVASITQQEVASIGAERRIRQIKMQSAEIEKLVKMTQSPNKYEADMARKELERKYPEIHAQIAFEEV